MACLRKQSVIGDSFITQCTCREQCVLCLMQLWRHVHVTVTLFLHTLIMCVVTVMQHWIILVCRRGSFNSSPMGHQLWRCLMGGAGCWGGWGFDVSGGRPINHAPLVKVMSLCARWFIFQWKLTSYNRFICKLEAWYGCWLYYGLINIIIVSYQIFPAPNYCNRSTCSQTSSLCSFLHSPVCQTNLCLQT